jgi:hypothetical protein
MRSGGGDRGFRVRHSRRRRLAAIGFSAFDSLRRSRRRELGDRTPFEAIAGAEHIDRHIERFADALSVDVPAKPSDI